MPGLVGLITKMPKDRAERELLRMVAAVRHETSYAAGTWCDERLGVYVGWTAHGGSFASRMPLENEKGDVALVFSGEDFPEPGIAARLKSEGHALDAEGPGYLAHLAEQDPRFLRRLNGRFHGVLADRRTGAVTLFNDRYGMHRIYWHEAGDAFYFAAEAKAILAVRPELRSIDPDGLAQFISCGCTLENRTLFRKIHVLPPASAWRFARGQLFERAAYFEPKEWEDQPLLEPEPYYRQLREVFSRNLPRYFEGPERLGISLTGGLDSRMIMSWLTAAPGALTCYSFGGMFRDSQDVKIARRVARACGQPHTVIGVGGEFLSRFAHYAERTVFLTDGCVEVKHAPDLYVNERAAQIAPVRITGNYGGEVLRHVRAFRPIDPVPGLFAADLSPALDRAKETWRELSQCHALSFAVFRQAPWHHYGLLSLERSQLEPRSPFLDNELVQTVFRSPRALLESDEVSLRLIADGSPLLRKIPTDRGLGGSLPEWAAAISRAWLEFTFKAEYAWDYGMPQPVVRVDSALSRLHLERLFLGRHKFYHFRIWYRDALASYVREMLLDARTLARPYLERDAVVSMVEQHLGGKRNYTTSIHKLLTLEYIHRLFIDAI